MPDATADSSEPPPPAGFLNFIDFGCGTGASIEAARQLLGGRGLGIDISAEAVARCRAAGLPAETGDLLRYEGRNTALAATAFDLLPEIGDRADFEQAVARMILAARNFVLIQHAYFDADSALALNGQHIPGHFGKRIRFKPTMADHMALLLRLAPAHAICGFAFFGLGEARSVPLGLENGVADRGSPPAMPELHRSLRVIIGRKEQDRFRQALRRCKAGRELFRWEGPDTEP
ncbi:class I SAM-dependent methyltransferase [Roseococcus sp. SDR]|uniref:methyltransferase domain-containing protein n=1 Tax=Roseococcus sp. SDR TaxID=2835532 RepID=UPI001BD0DE30|nr:class I SAM-dependent methyltransferase [Roseococcus sp. SDR]MBS7790000.1 class I SAM-dependent methyltransferase [Roseococcus sp. SDR]MBV1845314.1 class I SAM-dependent methyltransferase [Roseococcus sp. SDR]